MCETASQLAEKVESTELTPYLRHMEFRQRLCDELPEYDWMNCYYTMLICPDADQDLYDQVHQYLMVQVMQESAEPEEE